MEFAACYNGDDLYEHIMPRQETVQNPENSNRGKVP